MHATPQSGYSLYVTKASGLQSRWLTAILTPQSSIHRFAFAVYASWAFINSLTHSQHTLYLQQLAYAFTAHPGPSATCLRSHSTPWASFNLLVENKLLAPVWRLVHLPYSQSFPYSAMQSKLMIMHSELLVVAFGSAPGTPNWAGLLSRLYKAAQSEAERDFDVLCVVDPARSWFGGLDADGGVLASNISSSSSSSSGSNGSISDSSRVASGMGACSSGRSDDSQDGASTFSRRGASFQYYYERISRYTRRYKHVLMLCYLESEVHQNDALKSETKGAGWRQALACATQLNASPPQKLRGNPFVWFRLLRTHTLPFNEPIYRSVDLSGHLPLILTGIALSQGDSMGATASLLFSPLATSVIAFCPQRAGFCSVCTVSWGQGTRGSLCKWVDLGIPTRVNKDRLQHGENE
eukprot:scaffold81314_cov21-Tisochrysis_lutea.AAC.1